MIYVYLARHGILSFQIKFVIKPTTTQTINASTGAAGVWLDLGQVRLARDKAGMTALALALNFNDNLGDAYATSVKIRAVTVEPLSADLSGGGFGDVDGDDKKGA